MQCQFMKTCDKDLFIALKQNARLSVIQSEERIQFGTQFNFLWRYIMSKVFVQLLLSLAVVVSAAVGFSPDAKGKVRKTLREAKTFTQQIARSILSASYVEAESELSAEASTKASADGDVQVEAEAETDASLNLDETLDSFSESNRETSVITEASLKDKGVGAAEIGTNAGLSLDTALGEVSDIDTETSISIESESQVEIQADDLNLDVENEIESQLDIEVGIGN